jgi:integrase
MDGWTAITTLKQTPTLAHIPVIAVTAHGTIEARRRAQRAQVTPHAFRHTVATALVRQRDIVTAADILGHTNINTTRRYAKAAAHELEDAIQAIHGSRSSDQ